MAPRRARERIALVIIGVVALVWLVVVGISAVDFLEDLARD